MCRVFLGENGSPQFIESIGDMARGYFMRAWTRKQGVPAGTEDDVYRFLAAGSADVLRNRLLSGDSRAPAEIAGAIAGICKSIVGAYMEPNNGKDCEGNEHDGSEN